MRAIGHLTDESAARSFGDYLYVQGIENQIEHHKPEGWAIWVNDEDKVEQAGALLTAFRQNPTDPKYQAAGKGAAALREKQEKGAAAYRKKVRDGRQLFRPLAAYDYTRPPHEGLLNYEAWEWPMTGAQVSAAFSDYLDRVQVPEL